MIEAWAPGIKTLLSRGVSPPFVALAFAYYETPLTSGDEWIPERFSKAIDTVAEIAGVSPADLGEKIVALAAPENRQDTFKRLEGMQGAFSGLPNIRDAGQFYARDANDLAQGIRHVAATVGWPLPRLEGPSLEWCEVLEQLIAKGISDAATLCFLVRHNRVELKDGRRCEPLSLESAISTVATATGISDIEMRQIVLCNPKSPRERYDPVRTVARAHEAAPLLAKVASVVRAENAEPPLAPLPSRLLQPGESPPHPPWKEFPEPPISMRWRMGPGEDYMDQWSSFWRGLTENEKREYFASNKPPSEWTEWAERRLRE